MRTRGWPSAQRPRPATRLRPCLTSGSPPARANRSRSSSPSACGSRGPGSRGPSVGERKAFQYTVLRVVPDVERGERVNVGVVLYSPERKFLGARVSVDAGRLRAIAPDIDLDALERHLESLVAVAD